MTEEKNVIQKLLEIQKELKAPKGQWNKFGKYNYRSSEDILEAVKPLNAEHGLMLTLSDEPILIGERYYIKATATITDGKDQIAVDAYARESLNKKGMDDSQITGTASSYARKYAMNGLYLIDDAKDADTDAHRDQMENTPQDPQGPPQNNQPQGPPPINQQQIGDIKVLMGSIINITGKSEAEIFDALNKNFKTNLHVNTWVKQADAQLATAIINLLKGWEKAYMERAQQQDAEAEDQYKEAGDR
jgi:hypothetical protein